ncbi:MAG: hypothetical protein HY271_11485 [Deltaproteobacteria bacterium]|nr:hypothetical protein [Deltaproteobacteria bacterium]
MALAITVVLLRAATTRAEAPVVNVKPHETFSVTYTVEIPSPAATVALVRWELAGIDEVKRIRLRFDPERFDGFEGSGVVERRRGEIVWSPNAPYAHLTYRAALLHRHAPGKGFDSYVGDGWIVTRTSALFPRSAVLFNRNIEAEPESRARLVFRLPSRWDVVTVMPVAGPRQFLVESRERFDHPRGWLMLGRVHRTDATVQGTAVTIAGVPGAGVPPDRVLALLDRAVPIVHELLGGTRARLVIVIGADPMWRGGLSGEDSFYMHGNRPLQTPDRTSPYLHELFHVSAPFRPAADAHWVTEGLAEFYSIEIQRRIGILDDAGYTKALRLFARYGLWGHDFTRDQAPAIHNNSAPLVLYALDRRIRRGTAGARGLDDVVGVVARAGGVVTTARFLGAVRQVAGENYAAFFRRHVYQGERPSLPEVGIGGAARTAATRP